MLKFRWMVAIRAAPASIDFSKEIQKSRQYTAYCLRSLNGDDMKLINKLTILLAIASIIVLSVVSPSAKTIYVVNGYSYSIINNTSVALCGGGNQYETLAVPDTLGGRSVTMIDNSGFSNYEEITAVDFSQAVHLEKIGYLAFSGCTGISNELVIPDTVKVIGFNAFQNCSSIPSITINGDVQCIQSESFRGCSAIQSVTINGNVETIDLLAFADCVQLETVTIPSSVTSISGSAFNNCPNLTLGVWYGSYGYQYAKERNIPYTLLDNVKLGDTNGDGAVNINDVTALQRCLAELEELDAIHLHAADVDRDGAADITDATVLQEYLAEYDVPYPIGEIITQ